MASFHCYSATSFLPTHRLWWVSCAFLFKPLYIFAEKCEVLLSISCVCMSASSSLIVRLSVTLAIGSACFLRPRSYTKTFVAQTRNLGGGATRNDEGHRVVRVRVTRFVFLSVIARCYVVRHCLSFTNSFHGCNCARLQINICNMFGNLNFIIYKELKYLVLMF